MPTTGRLFHHLGILARSGQLAQLLYFGKSLAAPNPHIVARKSILTLFRPAFDDTGQDLAQL
jgi:hypothetical protein